jgi:hypothetical protein
LCCGFVLMGQLAVISWMQNQPVDETRGLLKKASDAGDFPLSNRLSIRFIPLFPSADVVVFKWRRKR